LPDVLVDALREHRRAVLELRMQLGVGRLPDDALLFATVDGEPLSPNAQSAAWADVADSIGLPDVTFHALRHTHASQLIDAGVDIVTSASALAMPNRTLHCASTRTCSATMTAGRGSYQRCIRLGPKWQQTGSKRPHVRAMFYQKHSLTI
jgi:hypothetical protein